MKFELGSNLTVLDSPSQYPLGTSTGLVQAKDTSASGVVHVESFEVETGQITYTFIDMSDADYVRIMEWFVNVAIGMLNKFFLTDDLDVTREVRFSSPKIGFSKNAFQLWNGGFTVEVENA